MKKMYLLVDGRAWDKPEQAAVLFSSESKSEVLQKQKSGELGENTVVMEGGVDGEEEGSRKSIVNLRIVR